MSARDGGSGGLVTRAGACGAGWRAAPARRTPCARVTAVLVGVVLLVAVPVRAGRVPRYGGGVRVELPSVPQALDPLRVAGDAAALMAACVFEGLTSWGAQAAAPGLARNWVSGDEGRRWVFHLRADVVFHDGAACDAEAVSESLHRLADPRRSHHAWILQDLVGWDDWVAGRTARIEGVYVVSAAEIELLFARPVPDLPERLALPAAAVVRANGAAPVGTGPFRVAAASVNGLRLAAFDEHYAGRPFLDRIDFAAGTDSIPGGLDAGARLRGADPALGPLAGTRRVRMPALRLALACVRPGSQVLGTSTARQRLSAFDAGGFVRDALGGDGEPAAGLVPGGPAPALPAAEEAGAAAAAPAPVRIVVAALEPVLRKLGVRLRAHLAALGQQAVLTELPPAEFATALRAGSYDVVLLGWTPPQPAAEIPEATRVRQVLGELLLPALGVPVPAPGADERLPPRWRDIAAGHEPATAAALLASAHVLPLVFFHDAWDASMGLANVRPSTLAADLGLAGAHLEPVAP